MVLGSKAGQIKGEVLRQEENIRLRFSHCLGRVPESGKDVKSTLTVQNIFMNCGK